MEANFESLIEKLSEKVKGFANTQTVVGEEFKLGEYTCKPVIKLGVGFGSGSGEGCKGKSDEGKGSGAGAGIGISPVGFLVAGKDGISFVPASNKKGLDSIFEKVPDLMEKMMDMKDRKEK